MPCPGNASAKHCLRQVVIEDVIEDVNDDVKAKLFDILLYTNSAEQCIR